MSKSRLLCLCAAIFAVGLSAAASAATKTAYFRVSATVIATCTIAPGLGTAGHGSQAVCVHTSQSPTAILPPPPFVTVTTDPITGTARRTIEF